MLADLFFTMLLAYFSQLSLQPIWILFLCRAQSMSLRKNSLGFPLHLLGFPNIHNTCEFRHVDFPHQAVLCQQLSVLHFNSVLAVTRVSADPPG